MINAGRVLIIPKGEWTNLESYEMLDLVTRGDIAYIARQASVGVDPATDTQLTYWQPFGTAAKIATTTTPGLVMPDGTTVTIDATGLISANIGINDINNVTITSISNGQILQYNSSTQKWENKSLGSAASRNATSSITSGSTDLIESGAVSSLKQTLTANVTQNAAEISSVKQALTNKANESSIAPVQTTLVASQKYKIGEQFYYQNVLYKATADISRGGTITIGGNCSVADDIVSQISKVTPLSFTWVSTNLNKGNTSIDIIGKFMFINIQCDGIILANGASETVIRTGVNIKTAVNASLWGGYTGKPVRAIITQAGEILIAGRYNEAQYTDQIRGQLIALIAN